MASSSKPQPAPEVHSRALQSAVFTPIEDRILIYLRRHAGRVCTHAELTAYALRRDYDDEGAPDLWVHVSRIRAKLGADAGYVSTVRARGYVWNGPTEEEVMEYRASGLLSALTRLCSAAEEFRRSRRPAERKRLEDALDYARTEIAEAIRESVA